MGLRPRYVVLAVTLVALVLPVLLDNDSFPLATYPMYARTRGDVVAISTATGLTSTGETIRLSPEIIGDSDDPLIVASLVRDAVNAGPAQVDILCRQIAERSVGSLSLDPTDRLVQLQVVTETHNVVEHVLGRSSLLSREIHATCEQRL
ncbi:MAG: hypothetical protein ACRBK7_29805 [Acidimicrobiales bacterium]